MKHLFPLALILGLNLVSACRTSDGSKSPAVVAAPSPAPTTTALDKSQPATPGLGKLKIIVSVDWEGRTLIEDSLDDMKKFRSDYPDIPIQHFLNAAYYTKTRADSAKITRQINSVLLPIDEQALHIHAWKSLVQASGVGFRIRPTFNNNDVNVAQDCDQDCGSDVALSSYDEASVQKIVRHSVDILTEHGFKRPVSFRAGGWLADHKVLRALASEGFSLDCSATYSDYLKGFWYQSLDLKVKEHWPDTTPISQPYDMKFSSGETILELPNNGSLADYMYPEDMMASFKKVASLLQKDPDHHVYLSIGFHQETALNYLERFRTGLDQIRAYAAKNKIPIEFVVPPLR